MRAFRRKYDRAHDWLCAQLTSAQQRDLTIGRMPKPRTIAALTRLGFYRDGWITPVGQITLLALWKPEDADTARLFDDAYSALIVSLRPTDRAALVSAWCVDGGPHAPGTVASRSVALRLADSRLVEDTKLTVLGRTVASEVYMRYRVHVAQVRSAVLSALRQERIQALTNFVGPTMAANALKGIEQ